MIMIVRLTTHLLFVLYNCRNVYLEKPKPPFTKIAQNMVLMPKRINIYLLTLLIFLFTLFELSTDVKLRLLNIDIWLVYRDTNYICSQKSHHSSQVPSHGELNSPGEIDYKPRQDQHWISEMDKLSSLWHPSSWLHTDCTLSFSIFQISW